ncbi:hypothetical protein GOB94_00110 [Granulicella sp. 5B5]|uniref:hypothetical protein n=1 Tax=Granulicella sp. 5B5 TaxID=1617967 RepID=UPI00176FA171|nr:hypothetical protein [Granulicella sp. 5B5]QMV17287.1 hypothetical protein GOB94_00110 [Granulicella sp. 5B5]
MTGEELKGIVEQRMSDPAVSGRIACNLRDGSGIEQRHHDGREFDVAWENEGDYWICTISDHGAASRLLQIDLHENHTSRTDVFEPCRVTISWEEDLLCVTRYLPTKPA